MKTKMVARVRLNVLVPFVFEVPEAQFEQHSGDGVPEGTAALVMANEEDVLAARTAAAKHAEVELVAKLKKMLGAGVELESALVEEVSER